MMKITVNADGHIALGQDRVRCALGRGGVCDARAKREGDGKTPAGFWPMRRLLWRPDRGTCPSTYLPCQPIRVDDGWCDDPADLHYNRPVRLPHAGSAERLWRDDRLYDLVVVIGYNDCPIVPGCGSAIFLHLASSNYAPTEGCVAMDRDHLTRFIHLARPGDLIQILAPNQAS